MNFQYLSKRTVNIKNLIFIPLYCLFILIYNKSMETPDSTVSTTFLKIKNLQRLVKKEAAHKDISKYLP